MNENEMQSNVGRYAQTFFDEDDGLWNCQGWIGNTKYRVTGGSEHDAQVNLAQKIFARMSDCNNILSDLDKISPEMMNTIAREYGLSTLNGCDSCQSECNCIKLDTVEYCGKNLPILTDRIRATFEDDEDFHKIPCPYIYTVCAEADDMVFVMKVNTYPDEDYDVEVLGHYFGTDMAEDIEMIQAICDDASYYKMTK